MVRIIKLVQKGELLMVGIIDRFEEEYCVIEVDGLTRDVLRNIVETGAKTGDVVEWDGSKWIINQKLTQERSREIQKLMDDLWED
jgi:hypothetical protein